MRNPIKLLADTRQPATQVPSSAMERPVEVTGDTMKQFTEFI